MKEFKASLSESHGRIVPAISITGLFGGSALVYTLFVFPAYVERNPENIWSMIWLLCGIYSATLILSVILLRPIMAERKIAHFRIVLGPDEVYGYTLSGECTSLRTPEIKSIIARRIPSFSLLYKNIEIRDAAGARLIVHHSVRPLSACIGAILSVASNCKTVDLGGLDRNEKIWSGENK